MTIMTPQRILELWPTLTPERQAELVEIAERFAAPSGSRKLTEREKAIVEQSRQDFADGRVLNEREYADEMDRFMADMRAKSPSTT